MVDDHGFPKHVMGPPPEWAIPPRQRANGMWEHDACRNENGFTVLTRDGLPSMPAIQEALMDEQRSLAGRTMVVSGGSRGIGLAIALGAAKLGGNVVLLAKTSRQPAKPRSST
jgi:hypothetical protein